MPPSPSGSWVNLSKRIRSHVSFILNHFIVTDESLLQPIRLIFRILQSLSWFVKIHVINCLIYSISNRITNISCFPLTKVINY